jgi:DNA-binding CsgD family transcriptional regulator
MGTVDLLIGRESELAVLSEVVDATASGHGGAVLIEGEAGIGKTRLLAPARARASAAGARLLYASTDETEAGVPLCDRARAELLLAGGRPRPPPGAGALTPAERRVAELAAQGATNREIARRLYLSPKTIEMHLHSAYRKLDLRGRDGLATALN